MVKQAFFAKKETKKGCDIPVNEFKHELLNLFLLGQPS